MTRSRVRSAHGAGGIDIASQVVGDGDGLSGMAVVIARRICDLGGAGDLLVSRTVKDLVTGSRIQLLDRGSCRLKGLTEDWHLFAAA